MTAVLSATDPLARDKIMASVNGDPNDIEYVPPLSIFLTISSINAAVFTIACITFQLCFDRL